MTNKEQFYPKIPLFRDGIVLHASHLQELALLSVEGSRWACMLLGEKGFFKPLISHQDICNRILIDSKDGTITMENVFILSPHGYVVLIQHAQHQVPFDSTRTFLFATPVQGPNAENYESAFEQNRNRAEDLPRVHLKWEQPNRKLFADKSFAICEVLKEEEEYRVKLCCPPITIDAIDELKYAFQALQETVCPGKKGKNFAYRLAHYRPMSVVDRNVSTLSELLSLCEQFSSISPRQRVEEVKTIVRCLLRTTQRFFQLLFVQLAHFDWWLKLAESYSGKSLELLVAQQFHERKIESLKWASNHPHLRKLNAVLLKLETLNDNPLQGVSDWLDWLGRLKQFYSDPKLLPPSRIEITSEPSNTADSIFSDSYLEESWEHEEIDLIIQCRTNPRGTKRLLCLPKISTEKQKDLIVSMEPDATDGALYTGSFDYSNRKSWHYPLTLTSENCVGSVRVFIEQADNSLFKLQKSFQKLQQIVGGVFLDGKNLPSFKQRLVSYSKANDDPSSELLILCDRFADLPLPESTKEIFTPVLDLLRSTKRYLQMLFVRLNPDKELKLGSDFKKYQEFVVDLRFQSNSLHEELSPYNTQSAEIYGLLLELAKYRSLHKNKVRSRSNSEWSAWLEELQEFYKQTTFFPELRVEIEKTGEPIHDHFEYDHPFLKNTWEKEEYTLLIQCQTPKNRMLSLQAKHRPDESGQGAVTKISDLLEEVQTSGHLALHEGYISYNQRNHWSYPLTLSFPDYVTELKVYVCRTKLAQTKQ